MPDRGAEEYLNVAVDIHMVIGPLISQTGIARVLPRQLTFMGVYWEGAFALVKFPGDALPVGPALLRTSLAAYILLS